MDEATERAIKEIRELHEHDEWLEKYGRDGRDITGLTMWSKLGTIKQLWDSEDRIEASDTEWLMKELEQAWNAWDGLARYLKDVTPHHDVEEEMGRLEARLG